MTPAEPADPREAPPAGGPSQGTDVTEQTWDFDEGDEIASGRTALQLLGGGHRYEAYLTWDDHLHSIVVAKLLRPHLADDEKALRDLAAEADLLARLDHPVLLRSFGCV